MSVYGFRSLCHTGGHQWENLYGKKKRKQRMFFVYDAYSDEWSEISAMNLNKKGIAVFGLWQ